MGCGNLFVDIDSLFIDRKQVSNNYNRKSFFEHITLTCNGLAMEYSDRYILYYIKK